LAEALEGENRRNIEAACQELAAAITASLSTSLSELG
jgi:hypothetical protein